MEGEDIIYSTITWIQYWYQDAILLFYNYYLYALW